MGIYLNFFLFMFFFFFKNFLNSITEACLSSIHLWHHFSLDRYIVSDCDSIEVMVDGHKWLGDTQEDAVSQVLKAGKCYKMDFFFFFCYFPFYILTSYFL